MTPEIRHDEVRHRFETTVDGQPCTCDYELRAGVMWITHTRVPVAVEGRGIAAELVRVALACAEAQGRRVVPACSYVDAYMRRHPETQGLLAE